MTEATGIRPEEQPRPLPPAGRLAAALERPRAIFQSLEVDNRLIAMMATGMVLVIVSRNIDLSVGSLLGFLGYTMAMIQAVWIPTTLGMGFDQPFTWVVTLVIGLGLGALVGGLQGFII